MKLTKTKLFIYLYDMYVLVVLISLSFSQKIPNIPQNRPFLYLGLFVITAKIYFMGIMALNKTKFKKVGIGAGLILFILLFYIFISGVSNVRAVKDFIITTLTGPLFVISLLPFYRDRTSIKECFLELAKILVLFSLIEGLIAWLLLAGIKFSVCGYEYFHQIVWGWRLHGIAGEPTHLGAIIGIGLLSLFFLYKEKKTKNYMNYLILFLFLWISLFFSGSRNAIISTIFSYFIILVIKKSFRIAWVFLCFFFAMILILGFETNFSSILYDILRIGDNTSELIRFDKLNSGIEKLNDSSIVELLIGKGHDFIILNPSFMNEYLELLIGYGIVWFIVLFLLEIFIVLRYLKMLSYNNSLALFGISLLLFCHTYFLMFAPLFTVFHITTFCFYLSMLLCVFSTKYDFLDRNVLMGMRHC